MTIIDTNEVARRLGLTRMRVVQLLQEGRIAGATKLGGQRGTWAIEVDGDGPPAVKPSGKRPGRGRKPRQPSPPAK